MSKPKIARPVLLVLIAFVLATAVFSIAWFARGEQTLRDAYAGQSFSWLNKKVAADIQRDPADHTLDYYLNKGQVIYTRGVMSLAMLSLLALGLIYRRNVVAKLKSFFSEASHPQNLAIFRMAVFFCLIVSRFGSDALFFAHFPRNLLHPPLGTAFFVNHLPLTANVVGPAYGLMLFFCCCGLLGICSRTSAFMTALLGVYVLGVPQLYGKVSHCHHLFWFPCVLAFSRCGDALSIDAIWYAWKRADRGMIEPPGESVLYGLPLRVCWVLIGCLYFWPGFWKLWDGGFAWVYSDNLLYRMHKAWLLVGMPAIRIDQLPLLCKIGAGVSVCFEISVIWLILWKQTRRLVVAMGLGFHNGTNYFMGISFWTLQVCYAGFVNWRWLFTWIGKKLMPQPIVVLYDGNCKLCRRTIATIASFDLLDRIDFVNAMDKPAVAARGLGHLDEMALYKDMHAVRGGEVFKGFDAYRAIAWRMPVLWFVLPLLYLPPIPSIGAGIYRKVADSRLCNIRREPETAAPVAIDLRRSLTAVAIVGGLLLAGNAYRGVRKQAFAWPVACYPPFAELGTRIIDRLSIEAVRPDGSSVEVFDTAREIGFSRGKFEGIFEDVLAIPSKKHRQLAMLSLWKVFTKSDPTLGKIDVVKFYQDRLSSDPEDAGKPPISHDLLLELTPEKPLTTHPSD